MQTDQGIKNIFQAEGDRLAGTDPDYANRDLYESIANGNFVSEVGCSTLDINESPDLSTGILNAFLNIVKMIIMLDFLIDIQPSWTLYIQVMTFEEAEKYKWNPFDLTKVCPVILCYIMV